jgi:hypothetical protein
MKITYKTPQKQIGLMDMIRKDPNNLNLFWNERRLVILALLRSNFDLDKALELNCPGMLMETYKTKLYRLGIRLKDLEDECYLLKI